MHDGIKYYSGMEIICRKRLKISNQVFYVNFNYKITKVSHTEITLVDECDDIELHLPIDKLTHFSLQYCSTGHSHQGATIHEPITIFNTNTPYVDRSWIWTAITRSTDFRNITIYEHSDDEVRVLKQCKLNQYMELKIKGYVEQDKIVVDDTLNKIMLIVRWVNDTFGEQESKCIKCGTPFYFHLDNSIIDSNLTIDRIDNSIAHVKSNCQLMCLQCNRCKK